MKVHEYQARELLADAGAPVPAALVAETADEAADAYGKLSREGASLCVIKAQVHAGGRGKGGGVKLVRSADEAAQAAAAMLSRPLVTPQTGPEGVEVGKLLVAAGVDIAHEYYLGLTVDRTAGGPVLIASADGGVEIETVAAENPDAIIRQPIHPLTGLEPYQARQVAYELGLPGDAAKQAVKAMLALAGLFHDLDCSLLEINPLVLTEPTDQHPDGRVFAIDAKANFDDNALYRQKRVGEMHDPAEEDAAELDANAHGLSYIKLDGNIGCLVNGAGLAMATMDMVKLHGGEPANFLDVGGGAGEEAVTAAFRIILSDQNVRGVLVNIFGGIMRCDVIARAIVNAAGEVGFTVPLIVRLEGTNVEPAREILRKAGQEIEALQTATDLTDAANKVTAAVA